MMRKFEEGKYQRDAGKIQELRVAFVVDAPGGHPQTQKKKSRPTSELSLVRLYRNSLSLRKTSTQTSGEAWLQTTHKYGDRLHEYTVKEAIHDGAVLGFKVDYRNTIISDLLEEEIPDQAYEDKGAHARGPRCHHNKSQQQLNIPKGVGRVMRLF